MKPPMQSETFRISGYKVKVFLGGDFHFLDDCLGHQGSAASYPSAKDLVTLEHLRNHGGKPHTPAHCFIDLRSLSDYESSYNENLAEDRMGGDLHKTGKFHESIVARSIFPIALENVVPPVLHIMLGIVLKLYKILLKTPYKTLTRWSPLQPDRGGPDRNGRKQAGIRQLASVRDPKQRLQLVFQRQELLGHADRSLLDKKRRKCPKCKTFIQKGNCIC